MINKPIPGLLVHVCRLIMSLAERFVAFVAVLARKS